MRYGLQPKIVFSESFMRIVPLHLYMCAVAAAVVVSVCASTPAIHRETNPDATFNSYKTFGFFSPVAPDKFGYESLLTQHLKDSIRYRMELKGYVFGARTPDLLLNFYVNIEDRSDVRTTPGSVGYVGYAGGYYGYRKGYYRVFNTGTVETVNYKQGTLTIDLVDAKQKVVAWTATAEGRVSRDALTNPGSVIDTLVTDMMAPLIVATANDAVTGVPNPAGLTRLSEMEWLGESELFYTASDFTTSAQSVGGSWSSSSSPGAGRTAKGFRVVGAGEPDDGYL
jgi:hypothetical protein